MDDFKPIFIAQRIENRIIIGLASITATIILLGWIAINENARMEEFTQRAEARSVEAGARLFENNCTSCHGTSSYGLSGVAPALNNPVLFGFSFFSPIDNELLVLNSQLNNALGEERAAIQTRIGELEAERLALEERILYDWSAELAAFDADLSALDEQITSTLAGVDSASRLARFISDAEAKYLAPMLAETDGLNSALEAFSAAEETPATEAVPATEAPAEEAPATEASSTEAEVEEEAPVACEFLVAGEALDGISLAEPVDTSSRNDILLRLAEIETLTSQVNTCLAPYQAFSSQRAAIIAKRGRFQAVVDAQAEVERLRGEIALAEAGLAELPVVAEGAADPDKNDRDALTTQAVEASRSMETAMLTRDEAYQALVDNLDIVHYDPNQASRAAELGWAGSLQDLISGTLVGGRPTSSSYWPQPMVAWSRESGGPLRVDQIANLVDYILNYGNNWTHERSVDDLLADVRKIQQFARIPSFGAVVEGETIGTNVTNITAELAAKTESGEISAGDTTAGQQAFANLGCAGCHGEAAGTGPARVGMWSRASNDEEGRLTNSGQPDAAAYMIQSIVAPGAYVVGGFSDGLMPQTFGDQLGYQQLADILAYLEAQ